MTERPPGLDSLLGYAVAHLPNSCEHRRGTWFDRQLCAEPCGVMHDRCVTCGEALDHCALMENAGHRPMYVRWENRHTVPAEVCDTCSDPKTGNWVPVAFCKLAKARLEADPNCTYTYGVLRREED
jgi:hypothetical protein